MAQVQYRNGQMEAAARTFERLLTLVPASVNVRLNAARTWALAGNPEHGLTLVEAGMQGSGAAQSGLRSLADSLRAVLLDRGQGSRQTGRP
jgi:predicted Zn-dependent protease